MHTLHLRLFLDITRHPGLQKKKKKKKKPDRNERWGNGSQCGMGQLIAMGVICFLQVPVQLKEDDAESTCSSASRRSTRSRDTRSQAGDNRSQSGDTRSQAGDNRSQSGDNRSQSDTRSQAGDNRSQSGDTRSETRSQAGDSRPQAGDTRSLSMETRSQSGENVRAHTMGVMDYQMAVRVHSPPLCERALFSKVSLSLV